MKIKSVILILSGLFLTGSIAATAPGSGDKKVIIGSFSLVIPNSLWGENTPYCEAVIEGDIPDSVTAASKLLRLAEQKFTEILGVELQPEILGIIDPPRDVMNSTLNGLPKPMVSQLMQSQEYDEFVMLSGKLEPAEGNRQTGNQQAGLTLAIRLYKWDKKKKKRLVYYSHSIYVETSFAATPGEAVQTGIPCEVLLSLFEKTLDEAFVSKPLAH